MAKSDRLQVIDATPSGHFAYHGECADDSRFHYETFTVGIFRVIDKRGGGKKAMKTIHRVKGWFGETKAQACAEYICRQLNSGKYADLSDRERARKCHRDYVVLHGKVM